MLVLTRKTGERIVVGDNIVITVVSHQGDRVKLGFEAPADVAIHRAEVFARIQEESRFAPVSPAIRALAYEI